MYFKFFLIALALPTLLKANDQQSLEEQPAEDQSSEKLGAPRSLLSSYDDDKSFSQFSLELAKLHLMEEILKKRKSINDMRDEVNENSEDKCSMIKKVGEPIVHHHSGLTQGAWMRDPLGILGVQKIWYMNGYSGYYTVLEFDSMDHFKAGMVSKTYTLPYSYRGTGAVVYGRYLYYNRYNSKYIVQYDLEKESVVRQVIPYSSGGYTTYSWGGYTYFDMSVDESGLWVLYSTSSYSRKLFASQLDPLTLSTLNTYYPVSSESMSSMGNAFVACGIIYCIDSYSSSTTTINYAYDTAKRSGSNPNIKFTNKFGYNSMVTYNPREKVLYAWDNKRQVTYPLEFN